MAMFCGYGGRMANRVFDPYYEWLGIQPSEQPADFYRLLGIAQFEPNEAVIQRAADRQMGYIRQFQAKHPMEVAELMSELSLARLTLCDGEKKAAYDRSLKTPDKQAKPDAPPATSPAPTAASSPLPAAKAAPATATSTAAKPSSAVAVPETPQRPWLLRVSGNFIGPLTLQEVQDRIKAGEVNQNTLVQKGKNGPWVLAGNVSELFDLPVSSPPSPGTGISEPAPIKPMPEGPNLLSGPLPEPEKRPPGRNVWICRKCRWPVPKPKTYCPRCGYVKTVNDSRATERSALVLLIFAIIVVLSLLAVTAISG